MFNYYYLDKLQVVYDRWVMEVEFCGWKLWFVIDVGVFFKSGIDYGSRVLIDVIELIVGVYVLDVGCGYGLIGFMVVKFVFEGYVIMIDINERVVEFFRENVKVNGIMNVMVL